MPMLRILLAIVLSLVWTVLGVSVLKWMGVDLKAAAKRWNSRTFAVAMAVNLLFVATALVMNRYLDQQPLGALGFRLTGRDAVACVLGLAVTAAVAGGFVRTLVQRGTTAVTRSRGNNAPLPMLMVGVAALFTAAFQEEILFRAYALNNLRVYGMGIAVVAAALIFTVWHVLSNRVHAHQMLWWLLGGLALTGVYLISGSVWVAAAVHFARNLANALLLDSQDGFARWQYDRPIPLPAKTVYYTLLSVVTVAVTWGLYHLPL